MRVRIAREALPLVGTIVVFLKLFLWLVIISCILPFAVLFLTADFFSGLDLKMPIHIFVASAVFQSACVVVIVGLETVLARSHRCHVGVLI